MTDHIGRPCPFCGARCLQSDHYATGDYDERWACGSSSDDNVGTVQSERCALAARAGEGETA